VKIVLSYIKDKYDNMILHYIIGTKWWKFCCHNMIAHNSSVPETKLSNTFLNYIQWRSREFSIEVLWIVYRNIYRGAISAIKNGQLVGGGNPMSTPPLRTPMTISNRWNSIQKKALIYKKNYIFCNKNIFFLNGKLILFKLHSSQKPKYILFWNI